jgi:pyruvate/2-oxoglutarate dehydrogenase complex dihydrolipoamide dehydrogenase (E3) component
MSNAKEMEMDTQYYDDIIIGGGKAGKTLAPALVADGRKTALVERSLNMIGGSCPNIACIPSKTMVASAQVANTVRNSAVYGINTAPPTVSLYYGYPSLQRLQRDQSRCALVCPQLDTRPQRAQYPS